MKIYYYYNVHRFGFPMLFSIQINWFRFHLLFLIQNHRFGFPVLFSIQIHRFGFPVLFSIQIHRFGLPFLFSIQIHRFGFPVLFSIQIHRFGFPVLFSSQVHRFGFPVLFSIQIHRFGFPWVHVNFVVSWGFVQPAIDPQVWVSWDPIVCPTAGIPSWSFCSWDWLLPLNSGDLEFEFLHPLLKRAAGPQLLFFLHSLWTKPHISLFLSFRASWGTCWSAWGGTAKDKAAGAGVQG